MLAKEYEEGGGGGSSSLTTLRSREKSADCKKKSEIVLTSRKKVDKFCPRSFTDSTCRYHSSISLAHVQRQFKTTQLTFHLGNLFDFDNFLNMTVPRCNRFTFGYKFDFFLTRDLPKLSVECTLDS